METKQKRLDIDEGLYIFQPSNTKRWYARFKIEGKWVSHATKKSDQQEATLAALKIQTEQEVLAQNGLLKTSKSFKDVASKAISNMQNSLERGLGKKNYKHYIQILQKYHIPFFGRTHITSIDVDKLRAFNRWREEQFKRLPAKSTLLNHNAAMQAVFKEAVNNKWMLASQVPELSTAGITTQRRAHFTPEEYEKVADTLLEMQENSRKEVSRQIRELAGDYAEFVINTGMRPGTELDNLTWSDIQIGHKNGVYEIFVTVRKGKNSLHTGTREVVCKKALELTIRAMTQRFPNRKPNDLLFRLRDGSTTKEISRTFSAAIKKAELEDSAYGKRTLYSLRHSYITWELVAQTAKIHVLAKQCGTSIDMIEQHYSHVVPRMHSHDLSGVDLPQKKEVEKKWGEHKKKNNEKWIRQYKEWQANYAKRGCI